MSFFILCFILLNPWLKLLLFQVCCKFDKTYYCIPGHYFAYRYRYCFLELHFYCISMNKRIKNIYIDTELVLPMYIMHILIFPSKIWAKKCALYRQNTDISEKNLNYSKEYMHPQVHCSIIYNSQDTEAAQVSISRWMDKTTMGHLHNRLLLSHKKEENFILCNFMDRSGEHAKWNKPVRERQIPYDFTHTWI